MSWSEVSRTAEVIVKQATLMGCECEMDRANTGTAYIELCHSPLCDCGDPDGDCDGGCNTRLIRVADHEPNEGRYIGRINREPDLFVSPGYQFEAVRAVAGWLDVDEADIAYLRREGSRRGRVAVQERAEAERMQSAEDARIAAWDRARARLEQEHADMLLNQSAFPFAELEARHGKRRKSFRRGGRYRRAAGRLAELAAEEMQK